MNKQNVNHKSSVKQKKTTHDSIQPELIEEKIATTISEPFKVTDIDRLEFTSGSGKKIDQHIQCDSSKNGFYGSYNLIDSNYSDKIGRPIGGTITIHSNKEMLNWKSTDTDQTIWEIHLKSNVISVWDSIKVGLPRFKVEKFGKVNNGRCIKKGEDYYSCDFNNFSAVYLFKKDTLSELTVTRKCNKN